MQFPKFGQTGLTVSRMILGTGTVELCRQLAFFILSCKPISYCRFKRIDVYIL
jgi:hypothetical protein